MEKEQVIKLIRTIVELSTVRPDSPESSGSLRLSEAVVRSVIAVAEHAEDPFRLVCIQTLTEIRAFHLTFIFNTFSSVSLVLIDVDLAARTGTIRLLLHVLGEGPVELARSLGFIFLHLVDKPQTRKYIKVGTDLEVLLLHVLLSQEMDMTYLQFTDGFDLFD